jgi:DNA-binding CsgD family transcriptional regulator
MSANARVLDPYLGASLIDAAGSAAWPSLLLDAAHRIGGVDEIFAYRAAADAAPDTLLSISKLENAAGRADSYVRGFFRFDPVTRLRATSTDAFVVSINAADLGEARYRNRCFDGPRFAEKLCFGWRDGPQSIVLSFYRRDATGLGEEHGLSPLANLTLSILARATKPSPPLVDRLEQKLSDRFPQLTPRERQVCARTIAGWTADRIAADLDIRPSSVLTYRQRAYRRLGVNSAHDFLEPLLH